MGRVLIEWFTTVFLNSIALLLVSQLFNGLYLADFKTALIASTILSLLNLIIRPILVILTIPITVLTLGLFILVINAFTLMIAQNLMGDGFVISGFGTAFFASIIISLISIVLHKIIGKRQSKKVY